MIVLVSAASNNYSHMLEFFIESAFTHIEFPFTFFVYDLGDLSETYKQKLSEKYPKILWKVFDYSKYPDYYNVQVSAGEYAWKSACIYESYLEFKPAKNSIRTEDLNSKLNIDEDNFLIWCDAGNCVRTPIENLLLYIKKYKLYSPHSSGFIKTWTHPTVLDFFNIKKNDNLLNKRNRNGAIMGFYLNYNPIVAFIEQFYKYSKIKNAICPEGSNRTNHRQDQALFSIMYYKFLDECKIVDYSNWYGCIMYHYHYLKLNLT
jgi:hypothetical protein